MAESADNTLMLAILRDIRKEQQDFRKEQDSQRLLLQLTVDTVRKLQMFTERKFLDIDKRFSSIDNRFTDIDKRFNDIDNRFNDIDKRFNNVEKRFLDMEDRMQAHKDDLELMLKAELLSAMGSFQTRIENYVRDCLSGRAD